MGDDRRHRLRDVLLSFFSACFLTFSSVCHFDLSVSGPPACPSACPSASPLTRPVPATLRFFGLRSITTKCGPTTASLPRFLRRAGPVFTNASDDEDDDDDDVDDVDDVDGEDDDDEDDDDNDEDDDDDVDDIDGEDDDDDDDDDNDDNDDNDATDSASATEGSSAVMATAVVLHLLFRLP
jgi:hypothetical protein